MEPAGFIKQLADANCRFPLQARDVEVGRDNVGLPRSDMVKEFHEGAAPADGKSPADVADVGIRGRHDAQSPRLGQPESQSIKPGDPSHVVFEDGEKVDDIEDSLKIGRLPRFMPEWMIECVRELLALQIGDEPFEIPGHVGDLQDFIKLIAVEGVHIDMQSMPHLFAIQDFNFDGRD